MTTEVGAKHLRLRLLLRRILLNKLKKVNSHLVKMTMAMEATTKTKTMMIVELATRKCPLLGAEMSWSRVASDHLGAILLMTLISRPEPRDHFPSRHHKGNTLPSKIPLSNLLWPRKNRLSIITSMIPLSCYLGKNFLGLLTHLSLSTLMRMMDVMHIPVPYLNIPGVPLFFKSRAHVVTVATKGFINYKFWLR